MAREERAAKESAQNDGNGAQNAAVTVQDAHPSGLTQKMLFDCLTVILSLFVIFFLNIYAMGRNRKTDEKKGAHCHTRHIAKFSDGAIYSDIQKFLGIFQAMGIVSPNVKLPVSPPSEQTFSFSFYFVSIHWTF